MVEDSSCQFFGICPGDHDIESASQRSKLLRDAFPCLPAHDQRVHAARVTVAAGVGRRHVTCQVAKEGHITLDTLPRQPTTDSNTHRWIQGGRNYHIDGFGMKCDGHYGRHGGFDNGCTGGDHFGCVIQLV